MRTKFLFVQVGRSSGRILEELQAWLSAPFSTPLSHDHRPLAIIIGPTHRNPFPTQFFSFCPAQQARTTKVAFFRRQSNYKSRMRRFTDE